MASGEGEPESPRAGKNWWETAGARIGVASGAVGLLVALLGLPGAVRGALGGDPQADAELRQVRTQIEQSKPRLDVRYVLLSEELLFQKESLESGAAGADSASSPVARSLLSLPVVQTGAASASGDEEPFPLDTDEQTFRFTTFLLIENRGQRDATGISVYGSQLGFAAAVPVREAATGGDDYLAVMRQRASGAAPVVVTVPRTLAPGDAVLLPLFTNATLAAGAETWWVTSAKAVLPDSLTYLDAVLGEPTTMPVRRMVNATRVERGVMDRG
jgi:hypothetical protein